MNPVTQAYGLLGGATKKRIQGCHVTPCHRHMVIVCHAGITPNFLAPKGKAAAPWQTGRGSNPCSVACVHGIFPVCYITFTCVIVFQNTRLQNHFASLGLEPLRHSLPKTGPAPSPQREAGQRAPCCMCSEMFMDHDTKPTHYEPPGFEPTPRKSEAGRLSTMVQ